MTTRSCLRFVRRLTLAFGLLSTGVSLALAQAEPERFVGLRLEEALRTLQPTGLRIVFTSQLVTPDMRVATAPRARAPREQLDELLEPHGLLAGTGPGGIIQVVRAQRLTLFAEVLNVLNRTNVGLADGFLAPDTKEAVGFTETLFPRLATVGVRVGF